MSQFDELLFPRKCPVCGEVVTPAGELICSGCKRELPRIAKTCPGCGRELTDTSPALCEECRNERSLLSGAISGYRLLDGRMAITARKIVEEHAFDRMDGLVVDFYFNYERVLQAWALNGIVPLPANVLIQFPGENPDEAFARRLSGLLDLPVRKDLLGRGGVKNKVLIPERILLCSVRTMDRRRADKAAATLLNAGVKAVYLASLTAVSAGWHEDNKKSKKQQCKEGMLRILHQDPFI